MYECLVCFYSQNLETLPTFITSKGDLQHKITTGTMNNTNYITTLPRLGTTIDTALATWETYLQTLTEHPTYESIVSNTTKDIATKVKALQHVLDTLPARHKALVQSYSDTNLEPVELSNICANLLEELKNPRSGLELDAWFTKTLATKKTTTGIAQLEKDIMDEEQGRLQELRRLKAIHMSLTSVLADGELGKKEVDMMLDAMEELGVSLADCGADTEVAGSGDKEGCDAPKGA